MIINCGTLLTGAALTLRSTDGALQTRALLTASLCVCVCVCVGASVRCAQYIRQVDEHPTYSPVRCWHFNFRRGCWCQLAIIKEAMSLPGQEHLVTRVH